MSKKLRAPDVGTYRPQVVARAHGMLQDAQSSVAAMLATLRGKAARGETTGKDAKALLDLLSAMEKIDSLEKTQESHLNLQTLSDEQIKQRALEALNLIGTDNDRANE